MQSDKNESFNKKKQDVFKNQKPKCHLKVSSKVQVYQRKELGKGTKKSRRNWDLVEENINY